MLGLRAQSSGEVRVLGGTAGRRGRRREDRRHAADLRPSGGGEGRRAGRAVPPAATAARAASRSCSPWPGSPTWRVSRWTSSRRPDAAGAVRPGAGGPPGPALPRRAHGGAGRGGAAPLLAVAAHHRRRGDDRAVRHPLPGRGGRQRQPGHRDQPRPGDRRRHARQIKASTSVRTLRAATRRPDPAVLLALPGVADVSVQGDAVAIRTTDADATLHAWYALGRPIPRPGGRRGRPGGGRCSR